MIALDRVCRRFQVGDQIVHGLAGVDLAIDPGEYIAIVGPSGSGKSTLLHVIGLLDHATEGDYRLEGSDVTRLSDEALARIRRTKIGFVFQFFHLIPRLTAAANIELPLMLSGVPRDERRERVASILSAFGLADRGRHRPDQLSGGQRQRVAIARATAMRPAILLADEPTGNLDSVSGREVVELLEGLNREGLTLIMVTHDADLSARAGREVRLVDGRIVADARRGEGR